MSNWLFFPNTNVSFFQLLTNLGLTTNLKCCLDPGDIVSYPGTGQNWVDRSGTQDWYLGEDGSASTDDPTFVGTAGAGYGSSQYFSGDGGDYFQAQAQPAYADALHKDGAKWAIGAWIYLSGNTNMNFFGTNAATNNPGVYWRPGKNAAILINVTNGSAAALNISADTAMTQDAWNFVAVSIDEATGVGGGFHYLNGSYNQVSGSDTFDATYSSPSSSGAANTINIFNHGGASPVPNGTRVGPVAIWQGSVISKANFDSIWTNTRGAFGV